MGIRNLNLNSVALAVIVHHSSISHGARIKRAAAVGATGLSLVVGIDISLGIAIVDLMVIAAAMIVGDVVVVVWVVDCCFLNNQREGRGWYPSRDILAVKIYLIIGMRVAVEYDWGVDVAIFHVGWGFRGVGIGVRV